MKNRYFVAQFDVDFNSRDIEHFEKIVIDTLENIGVKVTSIMRNKSDSGIFLNFYVSGLDYTYRDRQGTMSKPINIITAYFRHLKGFSSYELLQELEQKGLKDLDHADAHGYSVTFWTDSKYRLYRHKTWYKLEGKNHFIYNDDVYDSEFHSEIASYLINLADMKGK